MPRYLKLTRTLQDAIQDGTFPVGSLLPTEVELAAAHGVSRQTVRQAIGLLRQQNLVSARKGVGTRVESKTGVRRFSYSATSVTELLEIANDTELVVERSETLVARGSTATELGCRSGHKFLHLECTRNVDGEMNPLSFIDIYIDGRFGAALNLPSRLRSALFVYVEKQTGELITQIQQEIRATILTDDVARRLGAPLGSAALQITRRYLSTGRRLILVSVNTLPSDRFFYSVAIDRDPNA